MPELSSELDRPVDHIDAEATSGGAATPQLELPDGPAAADNESALGAEGKDDAGFGEPADADLPAKGVSKIEVTDEEAVMAAVKAAYGIVDDMSQGDDGHGNVPDDDIDWETLGLEDLPDDDELPDPDESGEDEGDDRYGVEVRDAEWESGLTARFAEFEEPRRQLDQEILEMSDPHSHPDFIGEGGDEEVPGAMAFRIGSQEAPEDKVFVTRVAPDSDPSVNETIVADRYDSLVRGHNLPEATRSFTEQIVAHDAVKGSITGYEGRSVHDLSEAEWQDITDTPDVMGTTLNVLSSMFETGIDPDFQGSNLLKNVVWNEQKHGFVMIDYTSLESDDYSSWDPDDPRVAARSAARDFRRFTDALARVCPDEAGAARIREHSSQLVSAYRQARGL